MNERSALVVKVLALVDAMFIDAPHHADHEVERQLVGPALLDETQEHAVGHLGAGLGARLRRADYFAERLFKQGDRGRRVRLKIRR